MVLYAVMVCASTLLDAESRHDWIVARTIGEDDIMSEVQVPAGMGKLQCCISSVGVYEVFMGRTKLDLCHDSRK